jgi:MoaA/NifB/PqqE/SkfB family radical SAM enzyme
MGLLRQGKRRLIPLQQGLARKLHDLTYLFIELINRCNLDCRHCGSDCTRASAIPDLPQSSVLPALREIASRYDPNRITVVLSGGEPLCYPGVFELGKAVADLGFPWGMVTNGFGWSRRRILQASAAGMRTATVSLDGLEQAHDWLRGRRGSFRKALETIRLLLEGAFLGALDVITCAHKRNLGDLDRLYSLLTKMGVPS